MIPEKVTMISSKYFLSLALTTTQQLYWWGIAPAILAAQTKGHRKSAGRKLFTWGDNLSWELSDGGASPLRVPHQLLHPGGVKWTSISCGLGFTVGVSVEGDIYVWGRNDKGHMGVAGPNYLPRKALRYVPPRTVYVKSSNPSITIPRKLSFASASGSSEIRLTDGQKELFISFVGSLEPAVVSEVSSLLLQPPVYCLPAAYFFLLAGNLIRAAEILLHIPVEETDWLWSSSTTSEQKSLFDVVFELICKHPDFIAMQSESVSDLLCTYKYAVHISKSKKLYALACLLLIRKPEMLAELKSRTTLEILEKCLPDPSNQDSQTSQEPAEVCFYAFYAV
ncbi:unnamed protein product [Gongylonema pulchrum]|uniref:Regulator of chromosome condensation (RCC1) family protein n=1 Tax=Gongylonema pulchrum TaxID=637853 RepID=A0A183ECF4_9BILA|nr:unnamed protein product [Gongylonema pulchrum]